MTVAISDAKSKWVRDLVDKRVLEINREFGRTEIIATPELRESRKYAETIALVRMEVKNTDWPVFFSQEGSFVWIGNMTDASKKLSKKLAEDTKHPWLNTNPASWLQFSVGQVHLQDILGDSVRLHLQGQVCYHFYESPQEVYIQTPVKEAMINGAFDTAKEVVTWYKNAVSSYTAMHDSVMEEFIKRETEYFKELRRI